MFFVQPTVIEESGVVIHHEHDEEDPEEEEDPDDNNQCMSASQLMHQAGRLYNDHPYERFYLIIIYLLCVF